MLRYYLKLKLIIEDALETDEKAQTLVEYGLILVLIAIVVFGLVLVIGGQANNLYSKVVEEYPSP
jgi:Flp pilus assembly pilin Flp